MRRAGIVVLLMVGCVAVGCRKSKSYTAPDGTRATVTENGKGNQITIEGKDGAKVQVSGEGGLALPEGFPSDVPVYPGSTVTMSMAAKDGMHVALKSADAPSKVAKFYTEKLKTSGWEIETTMNTEDGSMISGKKGKRSVMAAANKDSGGAIVTLTVSKEE